MTCLLTSQVLGDKFSERALGMVLDRAPTLAESLAAAAAVAHHEQRTHAASATAATAAQRATSGGGVLLFGVTMLGGLVRKLCTQESNHSKTRVYKKKITIKSSSAAPEPRIQSSINLNRNHYWISCL